MTSLLLPGFPGYWVTDRGEITSGRKTLKPQRTKDGYLYVMLRRQKVKISHAVLTAFVGPKPEGCEARHLNDDKTDNRIQNLAWGTRLENVADKARNGGESRGEGTGTAKLTEEQVIELRAMNPRPSLRSLAETYGVSHTTIRRAINGTKWSHLNAG